MPKNRVKKIKKDGELIFCTKPIHYIGLFKYIILVLIVVKLDWNVRRHMAQTLLYGFTTVNCRRFFAAAPIYSKLNVTTLPEIFRKNDSGSVSNKGFQPKIKLILY